MPAEPTHSAGQGGRWRRAWGELSRRTRWLVLACALIGSLSFVTQLAEIPARSALRGSDNSFNYFWLRSLMADSDWDFRNDIEECNTLTPEYREASRQLAPTPTGHIPNKYGVGWALVSLPVYLVADALVALGRWLGVWSYARDGYNPVYQICLQTGHALLAVFSLGLAYRVVRRWCAREPAVLGLALVWAASPLLYYQTSNLSMSHGVTFFAITLCVYGLVRAENSPGCCGPWLLAGVGLGLAVITRFQTAVYGLLPLYAWLVFRPTTPRPLWEKLKAGVVFAAGFAPLLTLQLIAWKVVYGSWLVFSYGKNGEGFNWARPEFSSVLFSPYHGLFYWHPLLLITAVCLLVLAWKTRGLALAGTVTFAVVTYVNAAWWCWWFGASFGGRAFEGSLLFLMAGLAWACEGLPRRWATTLVSIGIVCVGLNTLLLALYRTAAIPRNAPVTWSEIAHMTARLCGLSF